MSTTTAVPTIEDTVRQVLQRSGNGAYTAYAQPVVTALVERELTISERLVSLATEQTYLAEEDARRVIAQTGIAMSGPEPEVDDEPEDDDDEAGIAAALDRIERRLDSLTDFARRNGYRD